MTFDILQSPDLHSELQTLIGKKNTISVSAKDKKVLNTKQEKVCILVVLVKALRCMHMIVVGNLLC